MDGRTNRAGRDGSLVDEIRGHLLEDLVRCTLRPGQMIQLSRLAEDYGTSRTPVREALTQLERQGLVQAVPYKGYLVRPIDLADVHDVFFMRRLIEGAGAELAAKSISPAAIVKLRRMKAPNVTTMTIDYDRYAQGFHRTVATASGSPRLVETFDNLYNNVRRLMYAGIGDPRPDLISREHATIVDALASRDPAAARASMEQHITRIQQRAVGGAEE